MSEAVERVDANQIDYVAMQRHYYDDRATTMTEARALVHPDFGLAQAQAVPTQAHALLEVIQRTYAAKTGGNVFDLMSQASSLSHDLRILDFGCGVGRLMKPLAEAGFCVDGVDISERMLSFARNEPALKRSAFFLSSGNDCGGAPAGQYDFVYSYLCFQHICSRTVRNELLAAMKRALRPGGVVLIQMHYYPDRTAATVPAPHMPWSGDNFGAPVTNGRADVWPTPDELHLLIDDFSRHFEDLRLQFVNFPQSTRLFTEAYNTWFGHLIVSGSTTHSLAARLYAA
ncbi:MAG TPA: class I SAM-dependent methyltransferase [Vicinamibacterales bacterium]